MDPPTSRTIVLLLAAVAAGLPAGALASRVARCYDEPAQWPPPSASAGVVALAFGWAVLARPAGAPLAPFLGASAALAWTLACLALIDIRVHRLPDVLTLPLAALGLLLGLAGVGAPVSERMVGAFGAWLALNAISVAFQRLRRREGLGPGDAKLMAAAGAWLGWRPLPWTLLIACALAFLWIAVRLLRRERAVLARPLAFGAPLALAIWWVWLYSSPAG